MQTYVLKFYFLAYPTTTQNNTQQNEVVATKINTFDNISSADVIKQNNKQNKISTESEPVATTATFNENKYNQQRNKQMKQQQQQEQQQYHLHKQKQPSQQKLYNGLINKELTTTIDKLNNKNCTINTNTTTNNITTNTNTAKTPQQLRHSCLQTGDLSSELQCC